MNKRRKKLSRAIHSCAVASCRASTASGRFLRPTLLMLILLAASNAMAQTTQFTYQGKLTDNGNPANGNYDFQFTLFDALSGGAPQGIIPLSSVPVTAGLFFVRLDFGSAVFPGADRFLEIAVKPASGSTFTVLSPRQPVTSTPYTVRSATAASADTAANAAQLGGLAASGFIQNTSSQQNATDFNIGGTGTASILNAATQFNLGGNRILSNAGTDNLFVGIGAGASNTGVENTFLGKSAGQTNTTGAANSYFGYNAGLQNTTGGNNAFFGDSTGRANTTGVDNSFFGAFAGSSNTTGGFNSFFGTSAGVDNTTGGGNSFFGQGAGSSNTTAGNSAFFGWLAGSNNTVGDNNAFFGGRAGQANTTGFNNSFFGRSAGAINTTGVGNSFFGTFTGLANTTGNSNSFFGNTAGVSNTTGPQNSFFGSNSGPANTAGMFEFFLRGKCWPAQYDRQQQCLCWRFSRKNKCDGEQQHSDRRRRQCFC